MPATMNERQFQGRVLQWLAAILKEHPELPFSKVDQEVEVQLNGQKRKFNDLTLFDKRLKPICIFEIKLPDRPDGQGRSPRNSKVVNTTQQKADKIGAEYFVTWNINSAVLWKTFIPSRSVQERALKPYPSVTFIRASTELDRSDVQEAIQDFLRDFLFDFAKIVTGEAAITPQPLDEGFIQAIQSYLDPIINILVSELLKRYRKDKAFAKGLHDWAVEDQGWTWEGSQQSLPYELERTARLACNMLLNKIVFYEAMRKVYTSLPALAVPKTIKTADQLHTRLKDLFSKALQIDYDTVFTEEFIDQIPFVSDEAVDWWRDLIHDVEEYDFTKLPYEVIGMIFQRLIAPDERHKLGQYFTPANVVDLINAFCIRKPDVRVLDPGCGAGTFLVRAYQRLKHLDPEKPHEELLDQLWGIDIAHYPAHLTTINLAVRDLSVTENYPKVIPEDFFKVFPQKSKYPFPKRVHGARGLSTTKVKVPVPLFDAVVGNPPYTRQEEMEDLYPGLKDRAHSAIHRDWALEVSKRSSIYALFFLHGAAFLKEDGYLGLLTSNSWLDVDYGKDLQKFFLENFKIIAILESKVERWFPDAAVNTAITIMQHCPDKAERDSHRVKFVYLKVPLAQLIPTDEKLRFRAIEELIEQIEGTQELAENDFWRIYPITQSELWQEGLDEEGKYAGAKWGKYLRAPEVFFKILQRGKDKLCHLSEIAEVRFGIKTGANDFFYVKDITDDLSDAELRLYKLTRNQAKKIRVVEAGDGSTHLVEAEYLKPVIKSPREIESIVVDPAKLRYKVLMVHESKKALAGKHVLDYILWGEEQGFHKRPTCASREKWYDLGDQAPANLIWFKAFNDRFLAPLNTPQAFSSDRFYAIYLNQEVLKAKEAIACVLNSTFQHLITELWGRVNLGEGALDNMTYEAAATVTLNPRKLGAKVLRKLSRTVKVLEKRSILSVLEEVNQRDRQQLDEIVLEALGFTDPTERQQVLTELYVAICDLVKSRLERAQSVQNEEPKRRKASPEAIAEELLREFDTSLLKRFPEDFVPSDYAYKEIRLPEGPFDYERLTDKRLRLGKSLLEFHSVAEADFAQFVLDAGETQALRLPTDTELLRQVVKAYRAYLKYMEQILEELAASRTRDRKMKERIKDLLRQRLKLGRLEHAQMKLL